MTTDFRKIVILILMKTFLAYTILIILYICLNSFSINAGILIFQNFVHYLIDTFMTHFEDMFVVGWLLFDRFLIALIMYKSTILIKIALGL